MACPVTIQKNINSTGKTTITKQDIYCITGSTQENMPFLKIFDLRDLKAVDEQDKNCLK